MNHLKQIAAKLEDYQLDAMLITSEPGEFYAIGFHGEGVALVTREANYYFGYRCYFGMGSVEAWRFTQRLAGIVLGVLGLVLAGVMLVISMGFPGMDTMEMVWKAFWCLIWQAVLALLSNAAIWAAAAIRFDAKGNFRKKRNRK